MFWKIPYLFFWVAINNNKFIFGKNFFTGLFLVISLFECIPILLLLFYFQIIDVKCKFADRQFRQKLCCYPQEQTILYSMYCERAFITFPVLIANFEMRLQRTIILKIVSVMGSIETISSEKLWNSIPFAFTTNFYQH